MITPQYSIRIRLFLVPFLVLTANPVIHAQQPGDRDLTFTVEHIPSHATIDGVFLQPDGKILVAGLRLRDQVTPPLGLVRLNPDGSEDLNSFSSDVLLGLPGGNRIAQQSDGRTIVMDESPSVFNFRRGSLDGRLIRVKRNGSFDSAFALKVSSRSPRDARALAIQGDDKILVGGNRLTVEGVTGQQSLIRLEKDGTLDSSFTGLPSSDDVASLAIQTDGKILAAGSFSPVEDGTETYLIRLHTDGSLDQTYEPDWSALSPGAPLNIAEGSLLKLQADGKALVLLEVFGADGLLLRLAEDGQIDETFVPARIDSIVNDIAIQPDGKIILGGGFEHINDENLSLLARLNADGSIDESFASPLASKQPGSSEQVNSLALQTDGRLIVAGYLPDGSVPGSHLTMIRIYAFMPEPSEPEIALLTTDLATTQGKDVILAAEPSGSPPLDYRWLFEGSPISGATTDRLVIRNITAQQAGLYSIRATNPLGTALSAEANVTVLPAPTTPGSLDVSFNPQLEAVDTFVVASAGPEDSIVVGRYPWPHSALSTGSRPTV